MACCTVQALSSTVEVNEDETVSSRFLVYNPKSRNIQFDVVVPPQHGHGSHGLRHRAGQDGATHAHLSGVDRTEHRRDPARAGRAPAER